MNKIETKQTTINKLFRSHSSCTSSEHTAVIRDSSMCVTSLNRDKMWTQKTVILRFQTLYMEKYMAVFVFIKKFKSKNIWCAQRYARAYTYICRLEINNHFPLRLSPLLLREERIISQIPQPDNDQTCWSIISEDLPVSSSPVLGLQKCAAMPTFVYEYQRSKLRTSCLCDRHFTN